MTLRNIIKKAIMPVIRKPWNSDDMELHYGIWIGVSALYNKSGRQLGEENSRPFILNHHVPTTTIQCKYEGSRKGHAINISALRIAMTNFDALWILPKLSETIIWRNKIRKIDNLAYGIYILFRALVSQLSPIRKERLR